MLSKIKKCFDKVENDFNKTFGFILDVEKEKSSIIVFIFIIEFVLLYFIKNLENNNIILENFYLYFELLVFSNISCMILSKLKMKTLAKIIAILSYAIFSPVLLILKFAYNRINQEEIESNTYIIPITEFCIASLVITLILSSYYFIEKYRNLINCIPQYYSDVIKINSLKTIILLVNFYIVISIIDKFIIYISKKTYLKDFNAEKINNDIKYMKSGFLCNIIIIMIIFFMVISLSIDIDNDLSSELVNIVTMITLIMLYHDKRKS